MELVSLTHANEELTKEFRVLYTILMAVLYNDVESQTGFKDYERDYEGVPLLDDSKTHELEREKTD